jgi:hypothetical protein
MNFSQLTAKTVYTISLFASINNREYLRERIVASEDVAHSLAAKFSAAHEQDDPTKTAQVYHSLCLLV